MGVIFNTQNSQLLTWSVPTEEIFQVNGHNRPVANLPVVDFRSQPREMPLPRSNTLFLVLFLYFVLLLLLGNFERHCLFEIRIVYWQPSDKRPWIENGQRFAIHFQT